MVANAVSDALSRSVFFALFSTLYYALYAKWRGPISIMKPVEEVGLLLVYD